MQQIIIVVLKKTGGFEVPIENLALFKDNGISISNCIYE